MKMKQTGKVGRKLLSLALALALMVGFVPGMGLTALAGDETPAYAGLKNTINVVKFDSKDWYLIDYDDSSVTLLTKECVGASKFNPNEPDDNTYSGSMVESFVNSWYTEHISEDAKAAVNGSGMFLLTKDQANILSTDVLKCSKASEAYSNDWWLCSPGSTDSSAERVNGNTGVVNSVSGNVWIKYGVRPALKLDLSKVVFSDNTFALPVPPAASVTSGGTTTEYTTFSAALGAWSGAANGATLKLLSDVTTDSTISVSGTKTLDLNGHGIRMTGSDRVINVGGASLTLKDSDPSVEHKYTIESPKSNGAGLAVVDDANGTQTFTGGYITGGDTNDRGGGVVVNGGSLTMNGGTVIGNNAANHGGGVALKELGGTFIMNGGALIGNTGKYGGGLSMINASSGTVNGGKIQYNCTSKNGGGIHTDCGNYGSLTVTGGAITNNYCDGSTESGGGVLVSGMTFNLSGSVEIKDNLRKSGADNLCLVAGNTVIVADTLSNSTPIGVTMKTPGVFTNTASDKVSFNDASKFVSDDAGYAVFQNSSGQLELRVPPAASVTSGGTTTEYTTFAEALGAWADDSTLTLLSDVTISSTISVSGTKTLDLNGHGIRMTGSGSVIHVGSGASLTLNDSDPNGAHNTQTFTGGYITGGTGTMVDGYPYGGGVLINGGSLTMNGGTIKDNNAYCGGGVYVVSGATLHMTGGAIEGNRATRNGAGVAVKGGATFQMSGGAIRYNACNGDTGGVLLRDDSANFTMSGGSIQYNTGSAIGGIGSNYAPPKFSGAPVVKDNVKGGTVSNTGTGYILEGGTPCNVYNIGRVIAIVGALQDGAEIGMTIPNVGVGAFTDSTDTSFNDATKFVSDNSSYAVGKNADGQLFLGTPVTVTFDINGRGTAPDSLMVPGGSVITSPAAPTETGYTFGGWYTESECTNAFDFNAAVTADTTLYAKWTLNTYAVTFDANGGAGAMEEQTVSHNAAAVLTANTFTRAGCNFAGWNTGADGTGTPYADGASVTLTAPLTLYAQWTTKPVHTASGTVKQESDNAPISGATVRLVQGERKLAVTATNDDGAFSFSAPDGIYNIVAEHGGKTRTELVTLRADQQVHIVMPSASVNSVLEVTGDDTPNVMVGGLDELTEQIGAQGASVTVTMTVDKKDKTEVEAADSAAIETAAEGMRLEYIDISLTKTVDGTESPLTDTSTVLEIIVPYDFSKKMQTTVKVYRYHGTSATALTEATTKADGTYRLDRENNLVFIYANQFSTYAIGFTPTYAVSGTLNFGSFTGAVSFSLAGNSIQKTASSTVTNGEGSYSFTGVPAGTYDMTASWNEDGKAQTLTFTVMVPAGTP